jgi:hypothetical protein
MSPSIRQSLLLGGGPVPRSLRRVARARAGRERYQDITDKIITELKAARVPWVQPWG